MSLEYKDKSENSGTSDEECESSSGLKVKDLLNDIESYFEAEISEGYTFRNLIEYLRKTNDSGIFTFTPGSP